MTIYLFVIAAILSVCSVVVIVKMNVAKLIQDPNQMVHVQKRFFIWIACSKVIPVSLLIWGITMLTPVASISELYIPWALIVVTIAAGLSFITAQNKLANSQEEKVAIHTLVTIARPLLFSVPIMAAAFLYLMAR